MTVQTDVIVFRNKPRNVLFVSGAHLVWEEMVNACWCGLLAALSLLLDARYGFWSQQTCYIFTAVIQTGTF